MAPDGVNLREKSNIRACIESLDRRAHPREAGTDYEHVVLRVHYEWTLA
jgi:hypothetical protein